MDFFEDVVDIPIVIPLEMNGTSVTSLMDSLCNDVLQSCCTNLEGDINMDFLFDWFPFSTFCSLLKVVEQSS